MDNKNIQEQITNLLSELGEIGNELAITINQEISTALRYQDVRFDKSTIDSINQSIDSKPITKNYWVVRTEGGDLFDDFVDNGIVALAHDYITAKEFISTNSSRGKKELIRIISSRNEESKNPGRIYKDLYYFLIEMQIGDVVAIPQKGSRYLLVGEVVGEPYSDADRESHRKVRKVRWKNYLMIDKDNADLVVPYNAIYSANTYSLDLERCVSNFFKFEDNYHLLIRYKSQNSIHQVRRLEFEESLYDLARKLVPVEYIDQDHQIKSKVKLQSPGYIELISTALPYLFVIGLILTLSRSNFKVKIKSFEVEFNTEGLLNTLRNYFKKPEPGSKEEEIIEHMNEHDIEEPKDILDLEPLKEKIDEKKKSQD